MSEAASQRPRPVPWWTPLALSWSFLTVLPAPWVEADARSLAASVAFFPLVGLALGTLLGGIGIAVGLLLPPGPTAVLLLAFSAVLTGGLHLDGLMDTADGVFGGRTVERRLEIMRDSRVGSFGAIAGALALLGQYSCLAQLGGTGRLVALALALGMSRWSMALAVALFPSARSAGLGAAFHEAGGRWPLVIATAIVVASALATPALGLASGIATVLVVTLGGRFLTRRLGGLTGDTYGGLAVVSETLVLYLAVVLQAARP
jgi:adenosylcobinamide-GDP ribazoletransferase